MLVIFHRPNREPGEGLELGRSLGFSCWESFVSKGFVPGFEGRGGGERERGSVLEISNVDRGKGKSVLYVCKDTLS